MPTSSHHTAVALSRFGAVPDPRLGQFSPLATNAFRAIPDRRSASTIRVSRSATAVITSSDNTSCFLTRSPRCRSRATHSVYTENRTVPESRMLVEPLRQAA